MINFERILWYLFNESRRIRYSPLTPIGYRESSWRNELEEKKQILKEWELFKKQFEQPGDPAEYLKAEIAQLEEARKVCRFEPSPELVAMGNSILKDLEEMKKIREEREKNE